MRSAGNCHPQWGYLAPAPSFLRGARIVVVAAAVGATAGAAVVVSLLERPGADAETSIAAHALVTGTPVAATQATPSGKGLEAAATSPSSAPSTPPAPQAEAAAMSESKSESKPASPARRSAGRRHRTASNRWQGENFWRKRRWRDNGRLYSSRAGFSEDDPN